MQFRQWMWYKDDSRSKGLVNSKESDKAEIPTMACVYWLVLDIYTQGGCVKGGLATNLSDTTMTQQKVDRAKNVTEVDSLKVFDNLAKLETEFLNNEQLTEI